MKKIKFFTVGINFFISSLFYTNCSKEANNLADNTGTQNNAIVYAGKVTIKNSSFDPYELFIAESGSVLWLNGDNSVHTVTSNDGAFDSGDIRPGGNFVYTFNRRGLYTYHCKYHPEMAGVIRVMVK